MKVWIGINAINEPTYNECEHGCQETYAVLEVSAFPDKTTADDHSDIVWPKPVTLSWMRKYDLHMLEKLVAGVQTKKLNEWYHKFYDEKHNLLNGGK